MYSYSYLFSDHIRWQFTDFSHRVQFQRQILYESNLTWDPMTWHISCLKIPKNYCQLEKSISAYISWIYGYVKFQMTDIGQFINSKIFGKISSKPFNGGFLYLQIATEMAWIRQLMAHFSEWKPDSFSMVNKHCLSNRNAEREWWMLWAPFTYDKLYVHV